MQSFVVGTSEEDDEFWAAFNRLLDMYVGPKIRDLGRLLAEAMS